MDSYVAFSLFVKHTPMDGSLYKDWATLRVLLLLCSIRRGRTEELLYSQRGWFICNSCRMKNLSAVSLIFSLQNLKACFSWQKRYRGRRYVRRFLAMECRSWYRWRFSAFNSSSSLFRRLISSTKALDSFSSSSVRNKVNFEQCRN